MPPLAPPKGMLDDGALPGHPHREGPHLVEGDAGVVADAALGGTAGDVVLDAVAGEDLDRAVIHLDGEVDDQFPFALGEDRTPAVVEAEEVRGMVELLHRDPME